MRALVILLLVTEVYIFVYTNEPSFFAAEVKANGKAN
jgi:hypothetical protein